MNTLVQKSKLRCTYSYDVIAMLKLTYFTKNIDKFSFEFISYYTILLYDTNEFMLSRLSSLINASCSKSVWIKAVLISMLMMISINYCQDLEIRLFWDIL